MTVVTIARRAFLISASVVGGGILVGAGAIVARLGALDGYVLPASDRETSFGAWLKIASDGAVEVVVPHQEMGQGIYALAALLAAEGLKLAPEAVRAVQAPIHARFANPVLLLDGLPIDDHEPGITQRTVVWTFDKILRAIGFQVTGGSTSTRHIAEPILTSAASALDLLTRAAAERFGVAPNELQAVGGRIVAPDGKGAAYRELAEAAAKLRLRAIAPKPLSRGALVGHGAPHADAPQKTRGLARFGIDTREPGQLYAAIRHAPRIGGVLTHAKLPAQIPGVRGVVEGKDYVAIVAESFSAALTGLDAAEIIWDEAAGLRLSSKDIFAAYRAALDKGASYRPRWVLDSIGNPAATSGRAIRATYSAPFLAHATMEPINATALVTDKGAKVWTGHQSGTLVQLLAAKTAGVPGENVEVITPFLGGGFGRRADLGYVIKAVEIAKAFKGAPVQTIWTREEDLRDDVYRPAAMADVEAKLGSDGLPTSLIYRIAVPSVTDQFVARAFPAAKGGLLADRAALDGAIFSFYGLPTRSIESLTVDLGVPVGFWRSVGFSLNCFFFESFIDELAAAAGVAPIAYRARLLATAGGNPAARRAARLLEKLAQFDSEHPLGPAKPGAKIGRGVALTECFHSFVGQIADVEIEGGEIKVRRVHAVVDCGFAIDPPNVVAQLRSGINFGLSAALFGRVDIDDGRVVQTNFDSYPVLTLANAPTISVAIVDSGAEIGGVGEIGTPAVAPAVGNAIFAATGRRLRATPFSLEGA
jgi:isoquinoline 1-oxidoreductase beta subunit